MEAKKKNQTCPECLILITRDWEGGKDEEDGVRLGDGYQNTVR